MNSISRRDFLISLGTAGAACRAARASIGSVKIGVCAPAAALEQAVRFGFDYLEPGVAEIAAMSESAFQAFRDRVLASPLRCECFNSFIRKLRVVGNEVRDDELRRYLDASLERCHQLGAKVVVWGSAGSRNVPPGFSRDRAWHQIIDFLHLAAETARTRGIIIAIEPLRRQESNIINTGAEALRLVREVSHPNARMIIDYYHLRAENEDPQIIWEAQREIVHFHFANPHGRLWPKRPGEDHQYPRFFALVKQIGFRGGISIEGQGDIPHDAAASLAFFREELAS